MIERATRRIRHTVKPAMLGIVPVARIGIPPLHLAHLTVHEASPEELIDTAVSCGFAGVGMRITGFAPDNDPMGLLGDRTRLRELRGRIADHGLQLVNVCSYRLTDDIDVDVYAPVLEVCRRLGASTMLITCFAEDEVRRQDSVARLAEAAARVDVKIGLEFFRTSKLRTLDEAEALRLACPTANVGHIIDALHFFRAGHRPADLDRIPSNAVFGVQLCDGPTEIASAAAMREEVRKRQLPGYGALPLAALMQRIPHEAPIEIEAPEAHLAGQTLRSRATRAHEAGVRFMQALQTRPKMRRSPRP